MLSEIVSKVEERLTRKKACSLCETRDPLAELRGSIEVVLFLTDLIKEKLASDADFKEILSDAVIVTSEALHIARVAQREFAKKKLEFIEPMG